MTRLRSIGAVLVVLAVALAACGGGGSSPPVAAPVTVTSADTSFSVTQTATLAATPGGGTTTIALPGAGMVSGSVSFPPPLAPVSGTLTETVQNAAPAADGVPALSFGRRPQGTVGTRAATSATLVYIRLVVSTVLQLPGSPAFSFTVAPANLVPGATYYVAIFDDAAHPRDWDLGWEGPATVQGTTLTFTASSAGTFAFAANVKYWFALVATSAPIATPSPVASATPSASPANTPSPVPTATSAPPTPAPTALPTSIPTAMPTSIPTASPTAIPTPTPKPAPTPAPTATPSPGPLSVIPFPTVNVSDIGAAAAKTVSVSESPYATTSSFSESDTCSPAAGIVATIVTPNAHGPAASYTVTGVKPGTCTATFTDAFAQAQTVTVIVTTTRVTIEGGRW